MYARTPILLLLSASLAACSAVEAPPPAPAAVAATPASIERYYGVEDRGRHIVAQLPIEQDEVAAWHYEVERGDDGRVARWRQKSPNGITMWSVEVEYGGEVARRQFERDAYGTLDHIATYLAGGDLANERRSGVKTVDGCSTRKRRFDGRDRMVDIRCVDPDGNTVVSTRGCANERWTWTDDGHPESRSCFDEDDRPALSRYGVHQERFAYDEHGWQTQEWWLDKDLRPIRNAYEGCLKLNWTHDAAGNTISETCLASDDRPTAISGSRHVGFWSTFDRSGCEVRRLYIGALATPTPNRAVAEERWRRDPFCGVLAYSQLGVDGQPAANDPREAWAYEQELNDEGLVVQQRCRGENDGPVSCMFGETPQEVEESGSVVQFEYDGRGRELCRKSFKRDGSPARLSYSYPHVKCAEWDTSGRRKRQYFLDANGDRVFALGVWQMEYVHDVLGYQVREYYLNSNGERMNSSVACAEFQDRYDERQRYLGRDCIGVSGEPLGSSGGLHQAGVAWVDGTATVEVVRDTQHAVVVNRFLDTTGGLISEVDCRPPGTPCYRW